MLKNKFNFDEIQSQLEALADAKTETGSTKTTPVFDHNKVHTIHEMNFNHQVLKTPCYLSDIKDELYSLFNSTRRGEGNKIVIAGMGTGKTTTIGQYAATVTDEPLIVACHVNNLKDDAYSSISSTVKAVTPTREVIKLDGGTPISSIKWDMNPIIVTSYDKAVMITKERDVMTFIDEIHTFYAHSFRSSPGEVCLYTRRFVGFSGTLRKRLMRFPVDYIEVQSNKSPMNTEFTAITEKYNTAKIVKLIRNCVASGEKVVVRINNKKEKLESIFHALEGAKADIAKELGRPMVVVRAYKMDDYKMPTCEKLWSSVKSQQSLSNTGEWTTGTVNAKTSATNSVEDAVSNNTKRNEQRYERPDVDVVLGTCSVDEGLSFNDTTPFTLIRVWEKSDTVDTFAQFVKRPRKSAKTNVVFWCDKLNLDELKFRPIDEARIEAEAVAEINAAQKIINGLAEVNTIKAEHVQPFEVMSVKIMKAIKVDPTAFDLSKELNFDGDVPCFSDHSISKLIYLKIEDQYKYNPEQLWYEVTGLYNPDTREIAKTIPWKVGECTIKDIVKEKNEYRRGANDARKDRARWTIKDMEEIVANPAAHMQTVSSDNTLYEIGKITEMNKMISILTTQRATHGWDYDTIDTYNKLSVRSDKSHIVNGVGVIDRLKKTASPRKKAQIVNQEPLAILACGLKEAIDQYEADNNTKIEEIWSSTIAELFNPIIEAAFINATLTWAELYADDYSDEVLVEASPFTGLNGDDKKNLISLLIKYKLKRINKVAGRKLVITPIFDELLKHI